MSCPIKYWVSSQTDKKHNDWKPAWWRAVLSGLGAGVATPITCYLVAGKADFSSVQL